uniref:zinc-dependent metalloprotease n=1 Tax=Novipirellula sp. TaxID=2795430 RepID=UPI003568519A
AKADDDKEQPKTDAADLVDGMPEWFVGPLLADLVAHEVGHTLGLRHNFKASAMMELADINSNEVKGKKTFAASVMDYSPINYRYEAGETQGDYAMIDIGPYDYWAIEYGYTADEKKLPEILKRCSEPELQFATDEDTSGPDPLARRYDFAADPLEYCKEQTKLIKLYRERLLEKFVKEGDSWAKARRGYELTLGLQTRSVSMMANWVGGAFVYRDKKGDPGNRPPVEVVPAEQQRDALKYVIETSFNDDAYGLTPELLERMSVDKWLDGGGHTSMSSEATWPIHDRILAAQASSLTLLMNPTTLRRVYDNEMRLPSDQDALTLPELLDTIGTAVWSELDQECPEGRNDRQTMISSLRRNLQREHMQRLVDLVLEQDSSTAAYKPISNLARMELKELQKRIDASLKSCGKKMDAYSRAHLSEASERIARALEAGYTYGNGQARRGGGLMLLFGEEAEQSFTP